MKLEDYLKESGFTKASLSRALGVSKAAISKWVEIPDKWLGKLEGLEPDKVVPMGVKEKNWDKYTLEEMASLIRRRGGLDSMEAHHRVKNGNFRNEDGEALPLETDYEISRSIGLKVFEFHKLIRRYVELKK